MMTTRKGLLKLKSRPSLNQRLFLQERRCPGDRPHRARGLQQPEPTVKRHRAAEARRVRRSQHVHPRLHGGQGCGLHRKERTRVW